jgi:hypothetical protein
MPRKRHKPRSAKPRFAGKGWRLPRPEEPALAGRLAREPQPPSTMAQRTCNPRRALSPGLLRRRGAVLTARLAIIAEHPQPLGGEPL